MVRKVIGHTDADSTVVVQATGIAEPGLDLHNTVHPVIAASATTTALACGRAQRCTSAAGAVVTKCMAWHGMAWHGPQLSTSNRTLTLLDALLVPFKIQCPLVQLAGRYCNDPHRGGVGV